MQEQAHRLKGRTWSVDSVRSLLSHAWLSALPSPQLSAPGTRAAQSRRRSNRIRTQPRASCIHVSRSRWNPGARRPVTVFATVAGDAAEAEALLTTPKVAENDGVATRRRHDPRPGAAQARRREGRRVGQPGRLQADRPAARRPRAAQGSDPGRNWTRRSSISTPRRCPTAKAPPLAGSNFEELKELALLDAKTHNFAEAWDAGFTGTGSTVGVLDGGTDFGHPDLHRDLADVVRPDRHAGRLERLAEGVRPVRHAAVWLAAPRTRSTHGLSWYTTTTAATCTDWADKAPQATCSVKFATRLGPSRNFSAAGRQEAAHLPLPGGLVEVRQRPARQPPGRLPARPLRRARRRSSSPTPTTAGVYDTVYVDLDDDYRLRRREAGHQGLAGVVPRHERRRLHRPVRRPPLLHLRRRDPIPGRRWTRSASTGRTAPGELRRLDAATTTRAIGGHGTLTASNVVGQGVINGKAPTFSDLPGDGKYPGAVIGGAPHAKLAPYGDIYFSFDFSTQFGYFLAATRAASTSRRTRTAPPTSTTTAGTPRARRPTSSTTARRTTPLFSTGNGAPGFGTTSPPSPTAGIAVGASTQFGGTGWDSIDRTEPDHRQRRHGLVQPRLRRERRHGVDVVADGAYSAGDATLNTVLDGRIAWETWGGTSRSTPVAAGATALVYQAWRKADRRRPCRPASTRPRRTS